MASVKFLEQRVAGKKKEIEKLTKKLGRIKAAESTGWEKNPTTMNRSRLCGQHKKGP